MEKQDGEEKAVNSGCVVAGGRGWVASGCPCGAPRGSSRCGTLGNSENHASELSHRELRVLEIFYTNSHPSVLGEGRVNTPGGVCINFLAFLTKGRQLLSTGSSQRAPRARLDVHRGH